MPGSPWSGNWDGNLIPGHDTQDLPGTPTLSSSQSGNNVVSQVKTVVDNDDGLKRADELKKMIDDPKSFQGGRKWSAEEKEQLKQAENDYQEIQSAKKDLITSLDKIDSLFQEKRLQHEKLSDDINRITTKLKEIDKHLNEYEEKIKLLDEKGDNITDEEKAWLVASRKQIDLLKSEKEGLSNSLVEAQSLQTALDNTENTITKDLETLLTRRPRTPSDDAGLESADVIIQEMAGIKSECSQFGSAIRRICDAATNLFSNLFDSIKNISSKIAGQLKSTTDILAKSKDILNNYPEPTMRHQL